MKTETVPEQNRKRLFNFNLPSKLVMGCGSLGSLTQEVKSLGKRLLLVTGQTAMKRLGILNKVVKMLTDEDITVALFDKVEPEPCTETVNAGVSLAKKEGCEIVVGLGGGSVLDTAKAIAGIANKEGKVEEFQAGRKLTSPGLPFIAIPTTSGTGAEVTPNAVLINKKEGIKKSFSNPFLSAKVAIIDPELTIFLPPHITAYSGMDALCQAIESFVSLGSNPLTDSLCRGAIRLIGGSLLKAYREGKDLQAPLQRQATLQRVATGQARIDMSYGSLLGGIALFNARMGVVHGIAHPLGARYGLAHGLVCGLLLPYAMEFNLDVAGDKYAELAPFLGGGTGGTTKIGTAKVAISRIRELLAELDFPKGLGELGVKEKDFPAIAKDSMPSGSLKANPKKVSEKDVVEILKKAM